MQVIAHDALMSVAHPAFAQAGVRCVGLEELTVAADAISLHDPLLGSTRRLFDAVPIAAMKRGAVLINASRGGVVNESALAAALKGGTRWGAVLDVFEAEPMCAGSAFADCPNLVSTPYIAGVSIESNEWVSFMIAQRILEALA